MASPAVVARGLTKWFGDGETKSFAVREASFEANYGELLYLVGPSGSGKTSLGRKIFGPGAFYEPRDWPSDKPIIDAIAPNGDFNAVTGAKSGLSEAGRKAGGAARARP